MLASARRHVWRTFWIAGVVVLLLVGLVIAVVSMRRAGNRVGLDDFTAPFLWSSVLIGPLWAWQCWHDYARHGQSNWFTNAAEWAMAYWVIASAGTTLGLLPTALPGWLTATPMGFTAVIAGVGYLLYPEYMRQAAKAVTTDQPLPESPRGTAAGGVAAAAIPVAYSALCLYWLFG